MKDMRIMKVCHTGSVVFEGCPMYSVWYHLYCSSKDPSSPNLSNFLALLGLFLLSYYYKVPFHWKGKKNQSCARLSLICSKTVKFTWNIISDSQLTSTANLREHQDLKPVYQKGLHLQDHCPNTKKQKKINKQFIALTKIHKTTGKSNITTYTRITLPPPSHITWNHVQGPTRVASQLWRVLVGSFKLLLNAFSASPVLKRSNL